MKSVLRIEKINQSPVGLKKASSKELANFVSARPPTGDFYLKRLIGGILMRVAFVEKNSNSINFLVKTGKVTPNGFTNIEIQDRFASLKEAQRKAEISNYIFGKITEYCQKLNQKERG